MKTNNQRGRIEIIDYELSRKEFVSTKELIKAIEDKLDVTFDARTIQKDIELMKRVSPIGYNAPIKSNPRKKAWYYENPDFTIKALGLSEEDVKALIFYTKALGQFKDHRFFNNVFSAIEKVLDNFRIAKRLKELISNRTIFQIESMPTINGIGFIEDIVVAITNKKIIRFRYTKFDGNDSYRELMPYHLKEDKHFWYVTGILQGERKFKVFALDRMKELSVSYESFLPKQFNPEIYFKDSFGITVDDQNPVLDVILSFDPYTGNYIKTLKIHESQKVIIDNQGEYRISVKVRPSYEFYSKILSYGDKVRVISPDLIVNQIKEMLGKAYEIYE